MSESTSSLWHTVCRYEDIPPMLGVRALIDGEQVALFNVDGTVYALSAIDPFTQAAVMARGIVGTLKGQRVVASPIYKQHFNLETGVCLEDAAVQLKTYAVRLHDGNIELANNKDCQAA